MASLWLYSNGIIYGDSRTPWVLVKFSILSVQSWVLSFITCKWSTFQPYPLNTGQLVTSILKVSLMDEGCTLSLSLCLSRFLHLCIASYRLSLNPNKMQQLLKLSLPLLPDRLPSFVFHPSVQKLGIFLESRLTFSANS